MSKELLYRKYHCMILAQNVKQIHTAAHFVTKRYYERVVVHVATPLLGPVADSMMLLFFFLGENRLAMTLTTFMGSMSG